MRYSSKEDRMYLGVFDIEALELIDNAMIHHRDKLIAELDTTGIIFAFGHLCVEGYVRVADDGEGYLQVNYVPASARFSEVEAEECIKDIVLKSLQELHAYYKMRMPEYNGMIDLISCLIGTLKHGTQNEKYFSYAPINPFMQEKMKATTTEIEKLTMKLRLLQHQVHSMCDDHHVCYV